MPINIVRMEDIPACVQETLAGIRDGLLAARAKGILAEYPDFVDFEMLVVKQWEALESSDREVGETTEIQGGFSTEERKNIGSDKQTSQEIRGSEGNNRHIQNTEQETLNYTI
jgi:hypothetical protein